MKKLATLNSRSNTVRTKLQAALYRARKKRIARAGS